jgi:hypothetical protein
MGSGVLAPGCRWSWYLYHWSVFYDWWFSLKWVGYRLHTDSVLIALMRRGGKEPGWETEIWRGTPVPAEHDNVRYLDRGSRRVGFGSSSSSRGVSGETHPMFGGQLAARGRRCSIPRESSGARPCFRWLYQVFMCRIREDSEAQMTSSNKMEFPLDLVAGSCLIST